MLKNIFVFLIAILLNSFLFAAHPLTTDDAGIVNLGGYEMEIGYENGKLEDGLRNHSGGFSLKHGITEKMDIGVSFPYQFMPKNSEPFGNASLGLKFLLIKDLFAFSVANDLGASQYFVNGIVTKEILPVTAHLNFGYQSSGDENIAGETIYSAAIEYPFSGMDVVGEIVGERAGVENWLAGVRYKLGEKTTFNVAYADKFKEREDKIIFGFHAEF